MKRFVKTAMLAMSSVLLLSQAANAAINPNDLILGFNQGGGTGPNDYIINLGNASTAVGVGGTAQVDLSGLYSSATFNSLYGSLAGTSMSVLGGQPATAGRDLYYTVLRTSNVGTPALSGSSAPGSLASTPMATGLNDVGRMVNNLGLAAGTSQTVAQSDANSFFNNVLTVSSGSFRSDTGRDPSGTVASGSTIFEDLYRAVPNGAFTYLGYFSLDTSGSGSLLFTPSAFVPVPEPGTYGLIAGSGLLILTLRRQLKGQLA
jgi:hypothetical protein